jgi:hypothetical protein
MVRPASCSINFRIRARKNVHPRRDDSVGERVDALAANPNMVSNGGRMPYSGPQHLVVTSLLFTRCSFLMVEPTSPGPRGEPMTGA